MIFFAVAPMVGRVGGRKPFLASSWSSAALVELGKSFSSATLPSVSCSGPHPLRAHPALEFPTSFYTRHFSDATPTELKIMLYTYHICPFCNITKSLLSYLELDYKSVEVNPLTKAELKPLSGDYTKVPIALVNEQQVNGSAEIISSILESPHVQVILERRLAEENNDGKKNSMTMQQFQTSKSAKKWLRFARDDLAPILYPNICRSLSDSYDAFGYVKNVDSFSSLQKTSIQYLGALAMYFAASKIKSKRNITDERASLHEALDKFENEGLLDGKYSSGRQIPDMGDLTVFGVLRSVEGLNAHRDGIQFRGGQVKKWYDRMHAQVMREKVKHE